MTTLHGRGLCKAYGQRAVVTDVHVDVEGGQCLGIIGPNGSGKSTVLRMLGSLLRPDKGTVELRIDGAVVDAPLQATGLVAPWMNIYDEFSATELLELQVQLHGVAPDAAHIASTLERVGMATRAHDHVRELSSGLRQRVLLALAVHRQPPLLLMDEPSITLDATGKQLVRAEIERHRWLGGVVVLATNDPEEASWCSASIQLLT